VYKRQKLNRVLEGSASLSAGVTRQAGLIAIKDFDTRIELAEGQLFTAQGDVENLRPLTGLDVALNARFHPDGQPPAPANGFEELKLTTVSANVTSEGRNLKFSDLFLETNAFDHAVNEIGLVAIGRIARTEDGLLSMEDLDIQAGPLNAPYIFAEGHIGDVLRLKSLRFDGEMNLPASLALGAIDEEAAAAFGRVVTQFSISDDAGPLSLTAFTARHAETDLWSLAAVLKVGACSTFDGLVADVSLALEDSKTFFSTFGLKPVDTGVLSLVTSLTGQENTVSGQLDLGAAASEIKTTLDVKDADRRRIDATVFSPSLRIEDLRNVIAGMHEIDLLFSNRGKQTDENGQDTATDEPDKPELQPLILPEEADLVDGVRFLRETDIYADILFDKISGIQGVTRVSSQLKSEGGNASLGPIAFNYGSGTFTFGACTSSEIFGMLRRFRNRGSGSVCV